MKRALLSIATAALLISPAAAGQMQTVSLFIPAMTGCPSCPYIVKSVLGGVDGVAEVETVYATGIATVVFDDEKASLDSLRQALAAFGYDFERVAPEG